ncbi:MAG: PleD family two-component system response regulator [Hyphomonadaceae bacterium]|nr:PleD family two-component system response regulator [Hyphomonadaceae bacterium]
MSARILVADDIEANRRVLQGKLESHFHVVLEAANGLDAIKVAENERPEIILLDVMMPGIDGYETCKRLKSNPDTSHIPVVMVTALSDSEDRVRGLEAGAEDFITKPVDDFQLNSRIEALRRYNSVAHELRLRQGRGASALEFEDQEQEDLKRSVRILVMDTHPRRSKRLVDMLRKAGHEVSSYLDAAGESALSNAGVDLILLPLSDQGFDPLKICTHFRMSEMTRPISIIVACEPHETHIAARALAYGASDVIQMPIEPQELLARVRTQTRRTRYIEIMRKRVDRGLELSVIDQLTGLYNRRYMMNQLHQLMKRALIGGKPLSVIALDIDHFKHVNDTYGHAAGDAVLQEIAERLQANVRPVDMVCRPGGEEFVAILPDTEGDRAAAAAERVRRAVAGAVFTLPNGEAIDVTLSAGVAILAGMDDTPSALLSRGDKALYLAKNQGRNRVCSVAA